MKYYPDHSPCISLDKENFNNTLVKVSPAVAFSSKTTNIEKLLNRITKAFNSEGEIRMFLNGHFPDQVIADEKKLECLFNNLICNAIKYNYKRNCLIGITGWKDDDFFYFDVADNGMGIDKKYFKTIFNEGIVLIKEDRFGAISLGKGLPVVKQILDEIGGKITVRSKKGTGSLFQVSIPLK